MHTQPTSCTADPVSFGINTAAAKRLHRARALARAIEAAWVDSGHDVHCRVTPIRNGEGRILCYAITSDLRDGLPR